MNAKTKSIRDASPFLVAENDDQSPVAGYSADFQELCAQEMDRALGIHKVSLDSAVQLQSCAIEFYQAIDICNYASSFTPVIGAFLDTAEKSFAQCLELYTHCMEMQRSWLTLLAPYALPYQETVASGSGSEAVATAEELAYHMDIAIGEAHTATGKMAARRAGVHARMPTQEPEYSMDIAMGSRAA